MRERNYKAETMVMEFIHSFMNPSDRNFLEGDVNLDDWQRFQIFRVVDQCELLWFSCENPTESGTVVLSSRRIP